MHGVSEVIAIILILMITISIAGLAYTFMSSTVASTTSAASSAVTTTTSSMKTSFVIENVDIAKVYIRNTGESAISNLSLYVNEEQPSIYNITPSTILPGQVGIITIFSFIPDGATVKITSSEGFSASKISSICSKAVGCWKLDENSGTVAYDSSPYGNSGTLLNGASWTSGQYGGSLSFDGTNDYANFSFMYSYSTLSAMTWLKINKNGSTFQNYIATSSFGFWGWPPNGGDTVQIALTTINITGNSTYSYATVPTDTWLYLVAVRNETMQRLYVNGVLRDSDPVFGTFANFTDIFMGRNLGGGNFLNGTLDEVRIFNRPVY